LRASVSSDRSAHGQSLNSYKTRRAAASWDLISIFASQAIGRVDVEAIAQAGGRPIAQAFQGGPDQHGPALPLVDEAHRILDVEPILAGAPREGLDLAADRVLLGLLI
jgi:hypothetical protein